MRESEVEGYFCRRVAETGGEQRKCSWLGRKDAPDRVVWWPKWGKNAFVELKRPGAKPRDSQLREHERMRAGGFDVFVIDTKRGVDIFISIMTGE